MSRKRRSADKSFQSQTNNEAVSDYHSGRTRKTFTLKDLRNLTPITYAQKQVFEAWGQDLSLVLHGSAGTGKTMVAMFLALREVLDPRSTYEKVIIVRSATPVKDIGFMPGTLEEKQTVYELPYTSICNDLFPYSGSYQNLKLNGYIDFMLTSYLRGISMHNVILILDESASCTMHEIDSVITRLGKNSKIIICGDIRQSDLKGKDGMADLLKVVGHVDSFEHIEFFPQDIVRSGICKEWILARDKTGI